MAKYSFGEAPSEDDVLVIQGVEYKLVPFGMAKLRESFERRKAVVGVAELTGDERTLALYDVSIDLIANAVHPDQKQAVIDHIEDRVPPVLVVDIATAIQRGFADVDPTQQPSSSDGSSETGPDSTDGASAAE
jgi:hypothetical protein